MIIPAVTRIPIIIFLLVNNLGIFMTIVL